MAHAGRAGIDAPRDRRGAPPSRLVVVRHAQPDLREDVPPAEWELTAAGRQAALLLARRPVFEGVGVIASSPEPKALATAAPIAARLGIPIRVERDLRETERPELPLLAADEHRRLVTRYLDGEPLEGWEPLERVRARMTGVVARIRLAGGDAAIVSHGRALAILLGLSPEEWAELPLPAVGVAEAASLRVVERLAQV